MLSEHVATDLICGRLDMISAGLEKIFGELRRTRVALERLGDIMKEDWVK